MKIVDCFIFYNELNLLNYRLNILNDVVDYFVIVEATHTHVGHPKRLYYNENIEQFKEFQSKIIHVIVDDFPFKQPNIDISKGQQWINENFQRNCIKRGIDNIELNDEDLIIIADLDEIPDPATLSKFKMMPDGVSDCSIISMEMDMYYYNLNSQFNDKWCKAKIATFSAFKLLNSCQDIRLGQSHFGLRRGGWHLSYFGDEQFIKNKLQNFTHQEYNNEDITNIENIKNKIASGTDLFGRDWHAINKISIKDNSYLPPDYEKYLSKYYTY